MVILEKRDIGKLKSGDENAGEREIFSGVSNKSARDAPNS
jgi:hypothetical protein